MRNFYIFRNDGTGWLQLETIWQTRQDAYDAMNYEQVQAPDVSFIIGHDDDRGMLTIAKLYNDIPLT